MKRRRNRFFKPYSEIVLIGAVILLIVYVGIHLFPKTNSPVLYDLHINGPSL